MEDRKKLTELTGGAYILEMYRRTKNNKLNFSLNSSSVFVNQVHWTKDAALRFAVQFDQLLHDLAQIGKVWDQLGKTREENAKLLSPKALEVWDIFIRPVEPPELDAAQFYRISKKEAQGHTLTFGELLFLELYKDKQWVEMLTRLPMGGTHPFRIHCRACRVARLYALNAPNIILHNECRQLANLLIQYYWSPPETMS